MAVQITKIDDKFDGFTVEFTVTNTYRRTFDARPKDREAMEYAQANVNTLVPVAVEKPVGVQVQVIPQPVAPMPVETASDITPVKEPPVKVAEPTATITTTVFDEFGNPIR